MTRCGARRMLRRMDGNASGKLLFIVIAAAALAALAAWVIARSYRAAMKRLMSLPAPAARGEGRHGPAPPALPASPAAVTLADNRQAARHVALLLLGLSALISASSAALFLGVAMAQERMLTPGRLLTLSLINLWPVIPALGLLWRWSRTRVLGALALWFVGAMALIAWRSIEPQPLATTLAYLAFEIGMPMLLIGALCLGGATRAIAPWLMPLLVLLVATSVGGADLLAWIVEARPQWLMALPEGVDAQQVLLFFVLAPWLVAWWPAKWLGRALAAAYARRWLSELMVLFTAVWGVVLLLRALGAWQDMGFASALMLLPLAWIPVVTLLVRRQPRPGRPPTLLVLRVFQRDAQVQALFDQVIERWRATGNTVLIAGTDLVERTLDAGDIFDFLDGRLAERFVRVPAEVAPRIAAFELAPDAEGRHRVNEVYCHDSTWQQALGALVAGSDVVLMDLRSFKAHNRGCRHELGVLARAPTLARVVVLTDGDTALAQAREDAVAAPAGRFVWIDGSRIDASRQRELLAALFVADTAAHGRTAPA
ncbi:MAG: hypothetical protein AB7U92_04960 [Piscinibacter sp.]|uniref:hypothetical protein n=1 Tax=Piscinibacter sp. TaxID=1903157 RepID=UPI003D14974F